MANTKDTNPPKWHQEFMKKYPEIGEKYEALGDAVHQAGPLSEKERALVKLAISGSSKLKAAFYSHLRRAKRLGLSRDEVEHVALLTLPTNGFPAMMRLMYWIEDVYGDRDNES